jgi:plastocyanin
LILDARSRVLRFRKPLALTLALIATGCGGDAKKSEPAPVAAPPPQAVSFYRVDATTAGTVRGTITYRGPKPTATVVAMDAEKACVDMHTGKPVPDGQIVLGSGGSLANAFVYIKDGFEGKKFESPKDPVVLDQKGCMFSPRILGVQAGGPLAVRNSDPIEHNVHPVPKNNYEWNEGMSPDSPDVVHRFARKEVMFRVKCNLHPWMRAWIGVVEHPYFAVTGLDGSFDLKNVPPGDYTVAVWHEQLGEIEKRVTVAPSSSQSLSFTLGGNAGKDK